MTSNDPSTSDSEHSRIQVQCAQCLSTVSFDASAAGRRAKCKKCGTILRVPAFAEGQQGSPAPKPAVTAAHTGRARHGAVVAWAQVGGMFVAAAGLSLALYQQFSRADVDPARWHELDSGFAHAQERLGWLRDTFGDTKKDLEAFRETVDLTRRRSERLAEDLRHTEKEVRGLVDDLRREFALLAGQVQVLEMAISNITEVVKDQPSKERSQIDFTIVDGVVTLPNRTAGSVKLTDTTLRRSGGDIVISCLITSPKKNLSLGFSRGVFSTKSSASTADGTTIAIHTVNVGRTRWQGTGGVVGQRAVTLDPGVPVSVQWKLEVPKHHSRFSLLELGLLIEGVNETISYKNVAVP